MSFLHGHRGRLWVCAGLLAVSAWAEEKPVAPPPVKPATPPAAESASGTTPATTPAGTEPAKDEPRDPFSDTQRIRRQYDRREVIAPNGEVIRQPIAPGSEVVPVLALPRMSLMGCVQKKDGPAIALLQVENNEYFVIKVGDTVNVNSNGHSVVLKVKAVDGLSASVEIVGEGQTITIR